MNAAVLAFALLLLVPATGTKRQERRRLRVMANSAILHGPR